MTYSRVYNKAIKYSADHSQVAELESQLTPDELAGRQHLERLSTLQRGVKQPEWMQRQVLADALQDHGRDKEAEAMRNVDNPVVKHNGVWKPGTVKWRDVAFLDHADGGEHLQSLQELGPANTMQQIKQDYDYGDGMLRDEPAHNMHDNLHQQGNHFLSWRPSHGYVNLQERHVVPKELENHNYIDNGTHYNIPEYGGR